MPYLLNLAYFVALLVATPWLVWQSLRTGKYREGFAAKFLGRVPTRVGDRPCLWLHAVSVGEVNLLATLLAEVRRRSPEVECVVSTTTRTGYALARKKYANLTVFYCPLDFSWAVRAAMRRIRPTCLVLAELELWPNLVMAARDAGASVTIINGRLSEASHRGYRRIRPLVASVLRQVNVIAVQDATYAARFLDLGARPESVHVTGSMKYDGAETDRSNPRTAALAKLAGIGPDDVVFLAGSTQEPEEAAAIDTFRTLAADHPQLRLVIVPRHPERFDAVAQLLDRSGLAWAKRSALASSEPGASATGGNPSPREELRSLTLPARLTPRILLVDAVGELGAWWGTAHIAFVGGSLGNRGGQNMIEPAAYGAAVSFGPNTRNFRDIVGTLLEHDAAVVVDDAAALTTFVQQCLENQAFAAALGTRARSLVATQLGATARTWDLLVATVLSSDAKLSRAA